MPGSYDALSPVIRYFYAQPSQNRIGHSGVRSDTGLAAGAMQFGHGKGSVADSQICEVAQGR